MNFVVNARDAMPAGGRLTIESAAVDLDAAEAERLGLHAGGHLRLDVTDTGSGMDESVAAHVFEPFYTTKGVGEGTGLGLSTVYGIINQARGHVSVTSRVGTGTTFTVHLPLAEAAESALTVLVVTGDEATRAWAKELLEHNGFNVLEASDGRAARESRRPAAGSGPVALGRDTSRRPRARSRRVAPSALAGHPCAVHRADRSPPTICCTRCAPRSTGRARDERRGLLPCRPLGPRDRTRAIGSSSSTTRRRFGTCSSASSNGPGSMRPRRTTGRTPSS